MLKVRLKVKSRVTEKVKLNYSEKPKVKQKGLLKVIYFDSVKPMVKCWGIKKEKHFLMDLYLD